MINKDELAKFLSGTADERNQQEIESVLLGPDTVVDVESDNADDDSLIDALRVSSDGKFDEENVRSLADRIESLVPKQNTLGMNDVSRFLDTPSECADIGKIANYRIVELIAIGGSSQIFRALDSDSHESVFIPGTTLRELLQRKGKLELPVAIHYARQIAKGLEYAHARSVLHRDIKPDNIWICDDDTIKILDFGLARIEDGSAPITRFGTVIGTPSYMPPEQITGKPIDQRSDLFSLGVAMLEMLTGESPFKKPNLFLTLISVAGE